METPHPACPMVGFLEAWLGAAKPPLPALIAVLAVPGMVTPYPSQTLLQQNGTRSRSVKREEDTCRGSNGGQWDNHFEADLNGERWPAADRIFFAPPRERAHRSSALKQSQAPPPWVGRNRGGWASGRGHSLCHGGARFLVGRGLA